MTVPQIIWPAALKGAPSKAEYIVLLFGAFLDAILRVSPESDVTIFRLLLPIFLILRLPALVALPAFKMTFTIIVAAAIYMLLQAIVFHHVSDFFVLSYGALVLTAALFGYIVYSAYRYHGLMFVMNLLLLWYVWMVAASLVQIYFPYEFPNATYRAGVGRIYFGQENDASVAIAAPFPLLLLRVRPVWLGWTLFAAGMFVIYENGTRMAILAVALLMLAMLVSHLAGRIAKLVKMPIRVVWLIGGVILAGLVFLLRDVPIRFPDHSASLMELVVTPLEEVFAGQIPSEYTSVNVRVTTVIAGLASLVHTYGFGVGPGASRFIVAQHFEPGLVTSMHSFPVQMVVELGWLIVSIVAFVLWHFRHQIAWGVFSGVLIFNIALVASVTSGTVTNYFFLACLATEFIVFRMSKSAGMTRLSWPSQAKQQPDSTGAQ